MLMVQNTELVQFKIITYFSSFDIMLSSISNDRFKWIFCTRFEATDNARNKKNFLLRLKLFENEHKKNRFHSAN